MVRTVLMAAMGCLSVLIFTSCAPVPKLTRAEYQAMRQSYDELRTRVYPNLSADQVLDAVDRLFTLADEDYRMIYGETGCIAYRRWFVFMIFAGGGGQDYWYVSTEAVEGGVRVRIRQVSYSLDYSVPPTSKGGVLMTDIALMNNPDAVDYTEMASRNALYFVFFKRLDYLLGLTDVWFSCAKTYEYRAKHELKGYLDPFCTLANDLAPDEAPLRDRSAPPSD